MAKANLEKEDHQRDAAFNKAMHGKTAGQAAGVSTILFKDRDAKKAAVDEYFKHFDNKKALNETDADREVNPLPPFPPPKPLGTTESSWLTLSALQSRTKEYATLTRQYVACDILFSAVCLK